MQLNMKWVLLSPLTAEPGSILQWVSCFDFGFKMQIAAGRISGCTGSICKNAKLIVTDRHF